MLFSSVTDLAEEAQVKISNLTVQLQRLGLIYLRGGDKTIYRNKNEVAGQKRLLQTHYQ